MRAGGAVDRPSPSTPLVWARRLATAVAAAALGTTAFAQDALSYADAVRLAADAPTVQLATRALALAERQRAVAGAPVRGELSGGYRWTWGERDLGAGGVVDLDDAGLDPIGVTLSAPVFGIGPAADARARAAADVARATAELAAARRAAVLEATNAFQSALRARTARDLAGAELALARLDLEAGELRRAAGAASDADLARLRLAVDRATQAVAAADAEVGAADRLLALALGTSVGTPIGPLPDPAALAAAAPAAVGTRSDVLAAQLQRDETDRTAAATLRDQLPALALSVGAAWGDDARAWQLGGSFDTRSFAPSVSFSLDPDDGVAGLPVGGRSSTLTVGVALRVPLDPTVGAALAAAAVGRERAQLQLEWARARADLDADQRRLDLDAALANAELARAGADLARAEAELAAARFAAGSLSELALRRARLDADRAALDADRAADAARLAALRWLDALAVDPAPLE